MRKLFLDNPVVVSYPGLCDAWDGVTLLEEQALAPLRFGALHRFGAGVKNSEQCFAPLRVE